MKTHTVQLINGQFTPEQTKKLLLDLLSHKISYHSFDKFSNEERFGHDLMHSQKRIEALVAEKEQLQKWLESLTDEDFLNINCHINLATQE